MTCQTRFVRARLPIELSQILEGGIALGQESLAMVFDEADQENVRRRIEKMPQAVAREAAGLSCLFG
jgi:hypothetical protein